MHLTSTPAEHRPRARLAAFGIAAALLAAPLTLGAATPVAALPHTAEAPQTANGRTGTTDDISHLDAQVDELIDVRIGDVHPTQPAVGYDQIYYKLGRYSELGKDAVNKRFGDWCEANGQLDAVTAEPDATLHDPASFTCELPVGSETKQSIAEMKTVVIGPGGQLYLTDGHHTLTSFAETPDGGTDLHVRLRVAANLSDHTPEQFWQTMIARQWTWLGLADGTTISPEALPERVGLDQLADDPYRSLMYFTRDIGFEAGSIPFLEFYWAAWVRDTQPIDLEAWDANDRDSYLATVRALSETQVALDPATEISGGFTAAELGVLAQWNDGKAETKGEWNKLSRPYEEDKPGKLAYALAYKAQLPGGEEPPTDPGTVLGDLAVDGDLRAGGTISVHGSGFAPATSGYALELHSEPVTLAEVATDAAGAFAITAALPTTTLAGPHRLVLVWNGAEVGATEVQIEPAVTAEGGADAGSGGSGSADGAGSASGGTEAGTGTSAQDVPSGAKLADTGGALRIVATITALALMVVGGAVIALQSRRRTAHEPARR